MLTVYRTCKDCQTRFMPNKSQIKTYSYQCVKCRYKFVQKRLNKIYFKKHPWWASLSSLRTRCNNNKIPEYKYYGGRGIKALITTQEIKNLWFRDNAEFMNRASIHRIDNDGNYTYENCKFIELSANVKKRPHAKGERIAQHKLTKKDVIYIIKYTGKLNQRQLAKMYNVHYSTINHILTGRNWEWV